MRLRSRRRHSPPCSSPRRIDESRETDTHCHEWMHDGMQLRDRHVVQGEKPDYRGETIPDGTLQFLNDRYVGQDGVPYVFASEMTRPGETQYRMVSRFREGEAWR